MLRDKRGTNRVDRENMCHLGGVDMGESLLTGRERPGVVDNEIKSVCSLTEYRSYIPRAVSTLQRDSCFGYCSANS